MYLPHLIAGCTGRPIYCYCVFDKPCKYAQKANSSREVCFGEGMLKRILFDILLLLQTFDTQEEQKEKKKRTKKKRKSYYDCAGKA